MLVVETIARIRRAHLIQGKSIKAICRELHVSRKVVRKVLRSEATEFRYERERQPMPRLGAWRDELDQLLAANEARPSRERLTLIRVFEALRGSGYEGGYDAVRRYARTWRRDQASASAYVPLSFAPGEAYQFDWSYEIVLIGGTTVTVKVARLRLCHSRMLFVRAYPRETQEMAFDAHDRAFAFFELRQDGKIVGEHRRHFGRDQTVSDPWRYVPVLARKPGALRNGAPFKVTILAAVLSDEAACAEALREATHSADVVINILARRREPAPPVTILTPDALRLTHAPVADCARYDSLRRPI